VHWRIKVRKQAASQPRTLVLCRKDQSVIHIEGRTSYSTQKYENHNSNAEWFKCMFTLGHCLPLIVARNNLSIDGI
jgi:hypothetical protein